MHLIISTPLRLCHLHQRRRNKQRNMADLKAEMLAFNALHASARVLLSFKAKYKYVKTDTVSIG